MWWSSFAAQIIETSGSHDAAEIEDPHGWLAWEPLLERLRTGGIVLEGDEHAAPEMILYRSDGHSASTERPVFSLKPSSVFARIHPESVAGIEASMLDDIWAAQPPTGPMLDRESAMRLVLKAAFAVDLAAHDAPSVRALLGLRRSLIPVGIVTWLRKNAGIDLDVAQDGSEVVAAAPETAPVPKYHANDERWGHLRTYLEESEGLGRLIDAAWLGEATAQQVLANLQVRFESSLSQRSRVARTLLQWPASLERVAARLAHGWQRRDDVRALLLVLDCCSLPFGSRLADHIRRSGLPLGQVRATLALEPTLTAVSRKALAAGMRPPREEDSRFGSYGSTKEEKRLWKAWWTQRFGDDLETVRLVNAETKIEELESRLANPLPSALFVVMNDLDHLVHASGEVATMGFRHMRDVADTWMTEVLLPVLTSAVERGWRVAITSDHGATQISSVLDISVDDRTLIGASRRGDVKDMGERCVWPRAGFADRLHQKVNGRRGRVFGSDFVMLPSGIVSPHGSSFGFAHGGVSLEEIVVPYIELGEW